MLTSVRMLVIASLMVCPSFLFCYSSSVHHIANPVSRLDECRLKWAVDLITQVFDVHIYGVIPGIFAAIPSVVQDHGSGDRTPLVAYQVLQNIDFFTP